MVFKRTQIDVQSYLQFSRDIGAIPAQKSNKKVAII